MNSIRRTDITPDDHRNVAIKIMSTNGLGEAIRTLVLWSWIAATGVRGGSFAPAKLGHFSCSKVLFSGRAHTSELRAVAFNTFGDKTRRRGQRIEKAVVAQGPDNVLTCPIFWLGCFLYYTWQAVARPFVNLLCAVYRLNIIHLELK